MTKRLSSAERVGFSRSISDHIAPRTSPERPAVRQAKRTANAPVPVDFSRAPNVDDFGRAEKMKKEHRVPLSAPARQILAKAHMTSQGKAALLFPGGRAGRPLSDVALSKALHLAVGIKAVTVHRPAVDLLRLGVGEHRLPRDVAEMALAHAIANKVEAVYRCGDLLEKRTEMMEAWGQWCAAAQSFVAVTGSVGRTNVHLPAHHVSESRKVRRHAYDNSPSALKAWVSGLDCREPSQPNYLHR